MAEASLMRATRGVAILYLVDLESGDDAVELLALF